MDHSHKEVMMRKLQSVSNDPATKATLSIAVPVAMTKTTNPTPAPNPTPTPIVRNEQNNTVVIVSAAVILSLFCWLFWYMVTKGIGSVDHWDRLVALYNSVQTIIVAAVGALLGTQVSAGQLAAARTSGDEAQQRARKLETNIKAFQADISSAVRTAESGVVVSPDGLVARAMTLLH